MKSIRPSYLTTVLGLFLVAGMLAPQASFAATKVVKTVKKTTYASYLYKAGKVYKDEKVTFANPLSRCNTPAMQKTQDANVSVALKDVAALKLTPDVESPYDEVIKTYLGGLDVLWSAMEEPYCGYGAYGMTAAKHSYDKNINRLRSNFLNAVKKINQAK